MKRNWVVVRFNNGRVKLWRDYGQAWGSPAYEVLGYFEGTYSEARRVRASFFCPRVAKRPLPSHYGTSREAARGIGEMMQEYD